MEELSRRKFISKGASVLASAALLSPMLSHADILKSGGGFPIGFQSWVIKEQLAKDFAGTLKQMNAMGYEAIEMCSPPGYKDYGFGPLNSLSASEMKKVMGDNGIKCLSCHYLFNELKDHLQERIDFAKEVGFSQLVVSSFGLPKTATLDDWKRAADEMNALGERAAKSKVTLVFHNHNTEFQKLEGQIIYDVLLERLDPKLSKLQFQLWVIIDGYKAADYFRKHPGRFVSAHLYDWSGVGEEQVPLGKGKVDFKEFFDAAKIGGLKNCFVEMEMDKLKESAQFLKKL
jgi:sugar phosphate isomerase/epimerase